MSVAKNEIEEFVRSFDEAGRQKWNDEKQWWEPVVYFDNSEYYDGINISWLCDHLGDAQEAMEAMWCEILRLRRAANTKEQNEH